jgi:hypothetical protein
LTAGLTPVLRRTSTPHRTSCDSYYAVVAYDTQVYVAGQAIARKAAVAGSGGDLV